MPFTLFANAPNVPQVKLFHAGERNKGIYRLGNYSRAGLINIDQLFIKSTGTL
jgi:hypothetical protein